VGPLILRVDFTVFRWRVQAAVGVAVDKAVPVEGEVIPDGAPRLPGGRLWEAWQRARRRAGWGPDS
jgi:hypothetical protein